MPSLRGHISVIQERRFRLVGEDGRSYLFIFDHHALLSLEELQHWQKSRTPVRVEYSGEPNTISGVARAVELVGKRREVAGKDGSELSR